MGGSEQKRDPVVDYRFSLANERTFLAYLRTSLALDAGALAVEFLTDVATEGWRRVAALVLAALAFLVGVAGYRRWWVNEQAMRRGETLPASWLPPVLAVAVTAASAIVLVLVIVE